jgi:hypothetical protein
MTKIAFKWTMLNLKNSLIRNKIISANAAHVSFAIKTDTWLESALTKRR